MKEQIFEWDDTKNRLNKDRHGISFFDAKEIFHRPIFTVEDLRRDYGERRFRSIGEVANIAVVVVAHTMRNGNIRIISARKANKQERETYYEYLKEADKRDRGH